MYRKDCRGKIKNIDGMTLNNNKNNNRTDHLVSNRGEYEWVRIGDKSNIWQYKYKVIAFRILPKQ